MQGNVGILNASKGRNGAPGSDTKHSVRPEQNNRAGKENMPSFQRRASIRPYTPHTASSKALRLPHIAQPRSVTRTRPKRWPCDPAARTPLNLALRRSPTWKRVPPPEPGRWGPPRRRPFCWRASAAEWGPCCRPAPPAAPRRAAQLAEGGRGFVPAEPPSIARRRRGAPAAARHLTAPAAHRRGRGRGGAAPHGRLWLAGQRARPRPQHREPALKRHEPYAAVCVRAAPAAELCYVRHTCFCTRGNMRARVYV